MPDSEPNFELEYKTLADNIRWWSNLRFAQLTLFVILMAAIYSTVNSVASPISDTVRFGLELGAFSTSLVFMYLEFRANEYWTHFVEPASEIEGHLGFSQYSTRPQRRVRTSFLLLIFFGAIAAYWLFALVAPMFWPELI